MTDECDTCRKLRMEVTFKKGALGAAARLAVRLGERWPHYIEAANSAKAAYIKARDYQAEHLAWHETQQVSA